MLAFVLGGGGSRGALQVGALQALLEAGIQPDMLIGTSVGALNAALLASNPTLDGLAHLKDIWLHVRDQDVFPGNSTSILWNVLWGRESFFANENWRSLLQSHLPGEYFGDLTLPCYAVATDMDTGATRVFGDAAGDRLLDGLMSSTAIAPFHPAWAVDGRRYVDGGYTALLPLREAMQRGATEIISLNLTGQLMPADGVKTSLDMLNHIVDLLMLRQVTSDVAYAHSYPHLRVKSIDLRAGAYLPTTDFSHTQELIASGYTQTAAALAEDGWPRPNAAYWSPDHLMGAEKIQTKEGAVALSL